MWNKDTKMTNINLTLDSKVGLDLAIGSNFWICGGKTEEKQTLKKPKAAKTETPNFHNWTF